MEINYSRPKLKLIIQYKVVKENIENRIEELDHEDVSFDLGGVLSGVTLSNPITKPNQDIKIESKNTTIIINNPTPLIPIINTGSNITVTQGNNVSTGSISTTVPVVLKNNTVIFSPPISALPSRRTIYEEDLKGGMSVFHYGSSIIGGFSISSGDNHINIVKLKFRNIGTANLNEIIDSKNDIFISLPWIGEGKPSQLGCASIDGNTLILDTCFAGIDKNRKIDIWIRINAKHTALFLDKTVQLSLVPEESIISIEGGILNSNDIINNTIFPIFTISKE